MSDGNRVIVCHTNFLLWVSPFLSYELWKQRIELSKQAIQTGSKSFNQKKKVSQKKKKMSTKNQILPMVKSLMVV